MYLSKEDIEKTPRVRRLNIINSVSGIKPGNLIGTQSQGGINNLAIISSVVHLGSNPALLGYITRPTDEVPRHTYENILATGFYTINHIHTGFIKEAHYTSAKFDEGISEFEKCGLTAEFSHGFKAPFVAESQLKMAMKHIESVKITSNDTIMIVGEIQHLIIPDHAIDERGYIDLGESDDVGISGLNSYYSLKKIGEYPYARVNEVPDFESK